MREGAQVRQRHRARGDLHQRRRDVDRDDRRVHRGAGLHSTDGRGMAMQCCAMRCYALLCYAVLCCGMLCCEP